VVCCGVSVRCVGAICAVCLCGVSMSVRCVNAVCLCDESDRVCADMYGV
jgi:hypothetical protein